ncbi:MAG: CoA pyrophosphatase [Rubellimicrobium sp.]|nr:CoA pyrophosphatase [Rubellimicrobium sp.]
MTPDEATARLNRAIAQAGQGSSDFDFDDGLRPGAAGRLRPAGVLIGVETTGAEPAVILTRRALHLRHHPGQIALPGGGREAGDSDAAATALREAQEEIGLPAASARILGTLPAHETVTGFSVTPVVALITRPFTVTPQAGEVEETFRVPLAHLLDLRRYRIEGRVWAGRMRHYPVVPWGPYYIWGATARILHGLAERAE